MQIGSNSAVRRGEGLASATLPTDLLNKANYVWSSDTNGTGWSSPVILNGQVWL